MTVTADSAPRVSRLLITVGLSVYALAGALSGVFEVLLVPLRIGSTVAPVAVVLAAVSNVVLPWLSRSFTGTPLGAVPPVLGWAVAVVVLGILVRPEGDVILPGAPTDTAIVVYAFLLVGFVCGLVSSLRTGASHPARLRARQARR